MESPGFVLLDQERRKNGGFLFHLPHSLVIRPPAIGARATAASMLKQYASTNTVLNPIILYFITPHPPVKMGRFKSPSTVNMECVQQMVLWSRARLRPCREKTPSLQAIPADPCVPVLPGDIRCDEPVQEQMNPGLHHAS